MGAHSIIISFHKIDGALIIIIIYLFFCAFVILGAGGLVINEKNQVLAVREKYRRKQHWKLPGGMVDRGLYKKSFDCLTCLGFIQETSVVGFTLHP